MSSMSSGHLRKAAAVFAVWTTVALLFAGQFYLYDSILSELRWSALIWYLWALLTPLVLLVARRFRFTRESWPRALAVHAAYGAPMRETQSVQRRVRMNDVEAARL
jgi:hypothetical protein